MLPVPASEWFENSMQALQRKRGDFGDVVAVEFDGKRFGAQALAMTCAAIGRDHELSHALLHHGAVGIGKRGEDVAFGAGERAHVARFHLLLQRSAVSAGVKPG